MFMIHVAFDVEAGPFFPYCAQFLTHVGDNLLCEQKTDWSTLVEKHDYVHLGDCLNVSHLELLVGEAALWAAGALHSDSGGGLFWPTYLQEGGEHAPPENTVSSTSPYMIVQPATWQKRCSLLAAQAWCLVDHIFSCHNSSTVEIISSM